MSPTAHLEAALSASNPRNPEKKTWIAITITTFAVIYIFFDSFEKGDIKGNFFGLICAFGMATGAVIIRSAKKVNLVPSAMMGKLFVALIALIFADKFSLCAFPITAFLLIPPINH